MEKIWAKEHPQAKISKVSDSRSSLEIFNIRHTKSNGLIDLNFKVEKHIPSIKLLKVAICKQELLQMHLSPGSKLHGGEASTTMQRRIPTFV